MADRDYEDEIYFDDFEDDSVAVQLIQNTIHQLHESSTRNSCDVLTLADVRQNAFRSVADTAELLSIDPSFAELFLQEYHWDASQLIHEWLDDPYQVLRKAGVDLSIEDFNALAQYGQNNVQHPTKSARRELKSPSKCPICFEPICKADAATLPCGHTFDEHCLSEFLRVAVEEGVDSVKSKRCPMFKCTLPIPNHIWERYLEEDALKRYIKFKSFIFISTNASLRWCIAADCNKVLWLRSSDPRHQGSVKCSCGARFCFSCGLEPHAPAPCDICRRWIAKNKSESLNVTWILVNTKGCPSCHRAIEKNQGCMHMTCHCGHQFCWLCLAAWDKHTTNPQCNVFTSNTDAERQSEIQTRAKESLHRYTHFFERFKAHDHAESMAIKVQLPEITKEKTKLRKRFPHVSDFSFLEEAVLQIIECRRFIKWSYAFGFYVDWSKQQHRKALFEDQQSFLEQAVDQLQELAETFRKDQFFIKDKITKGCKFDEFRLQLISLTKVVKDFFGRMCDAFREEYVFFTTEADEKQLAASVEKHQQSRGRSFNNN